MSHSCHPKEQTHQCFSPGLTWVGWQVGEGHRLALHLVWDATQWHTDLHLLREVLVLVRWRLEHNSDLPVHVCLGELPVRLPRAAPEYDLDVICGSVTTRKVTFISSSPGLTQGIYHFSVYKYLILFSSKTIITALWLFASIIQCSSSLHIFLS